MHVHSSFSEGHGSLESHTWESERVGLDAVWWSDHGWRVDSYRHCSSFTFDDWTEPLDQNEDWVANRLTEVKGLKSVVLSELGQFDSTLASIDSVQPFEGLGCLRLEATSSLPSFQSLDYQVIAQRARFRRMLAGGISVGIAVLPESAEADAEPFVEFPLSLHPDPNVPINTRYVLRYVLSNDGASPTIEAGVYTIHVPYVEGVWNELSLSVTTDAIQAFAPFDGADNALGEILVGVRSRNGAMAAALFDDLVVTQTTDPEDMFQVEDSMLPGLEARYPTVAQIQGVEQSYVGVHFNEFSLNPALMDYDALYASSGLLDENGQITDVSAMTLYVDAAIVDAVHDRGGVISYNHMFGAGTLTTANSPAKEDVRDALISTRVKGADILEVGYRQREASLADFIWVWDQLGLAGIHVIGTGVTDSHSGARTEYDSTINNFVSWIWADSISTSDLLDGLKCGRVFFGDITQFDGEVDLCTSDGHNMGSVVLTDAVTKDVTLNIDGLLAGDVVTLLGAGVVLATWTADGQPFQQTTTVNVVPGEGYVVRAEIHDAAGGEKAFSNPIVLATQFPKGGIPAPRLALDLGGVVSTQAQGLELTAARYSVMPFARALSLIGQAEGGQVTLDVSAAGLPRGVLFFGMTGTWRMSGNSLFLEDLEGTGGAVVLF